MKMVLVELIEGTQRETFRPCQMTDSRELATNIQLQFPVRHFAFSFSTHIVVFTYRELSLKLNYHFSITKMISSPSPILPGKFIKASLSSKIFSVKKIRIY